MTTTVTAPAYGSPEWVAERRNYVGASDVPMILGLSPFGSAYDVWLTKTGRTDPNAMTDAQRWGHYHEPAIAAEYARQFPDVTLEAVGTLPHAKYDWLRATVDRLVHPSSGTPYPLEIKSTSEYMGRAWGEVGTDDIPDHVIVQAQVQLMVLGVAWAHVAVLVGHSDCRLPYLVEADAGLQEMILDGVHEFKTRYLDGGEEPPITGPNMAEHLARKHQKHSKVVRAASDDEAEILTRYFETYAKRKALKEQEKELAARIMAMIGGDYGVQCDAGKVLWYSVRGRASLDTQGLIRQLRVPQDVLNSFTRRGESSRTFRPYPSGD